MKHIKVVLDTPSILDIALFATLCFRSSCICSFLSSSLLVPRLPFGLPNLIPWDFFAARACFVLWLNRSLSSSDSKLNRVTNTLVWISFLPLIQRFCFMAMNFIFLLISSLVIFITSPVLLPILDSSLVIRVSSSFNFSNNSSILRFFLSCLLEISISTNSSIEILFFCEYSRISSFWFFKSCLSVLTL